MGRVATAAADGAWPRRARLAPWALAPLLLAVLGSATADLRGTLSPFAVAAAADTEQGAAAQVDPPTIGLGDDEISLYSPRLLAELYAERGFEPAWDTRRAQAMLALARQSREDGFIPADFHAEAISAILESGDLHDVDQDRRDAAELLLSDALLRYVHHFRFGKHNPEHLNRGWTFVKPADAERLKADMRQALGAADMQAELRGLMPNPDFYRNLKKGYQRYLAIADRGGWEEIPAGANLRVGASDPRIPLVREHLQVVDGYEPGFVSEPEVYDEALAEAVKDFQRRSGLAADGIVGPNTLRALNQPLDDRLLAIRANLERMRWLYNDLPPDYLFVDLTAFELYLMRDNEEVWRTKAIIGTTQNQTPMFRDEMEHLVFNPTWTVPPSIEKKFRGVPAGYRRVRSGGRYYLVQQPGPRNALGRVKFMFPNGHAIYLHDTPSRYLFDRGERAYSHGCVRVHQPLTLAQHVLNDSAWGEAEINRVVRRGSTRWVHLDEHLQVLLYYLTAKADEQGRVGFRRDIYNRDRRLIAALDEPVEGTGRIAFAEPEPESTPVPEGSAKVAAAEDSAEAPPPQAEAVTVADTHSDVADGSTRAEDGSVERAVDTAAADLSTQTQAVEVTETGAAAEDATRDHGDIAVAAETDEATSGQDGTARSEAQSATQSDVARPAAAGPSGPVVSVAGAAASEAVDAGSSGAAADEDVAARVPALASGSEEPTEAQASGAVDGAASAVPEAPAAPKQPTQTDVEPTTADGAAPSNEPLASRPSVLRLEAQQGFSGFSVAPPALAAPQAAGLDLSAPASPMRIMSTTSGFGTAAAADNLLLPGLGMESSPVADEPPVWSLPDD